MVSIHLAVLQVIVEHKEREEVEGGECLTHLLNIYEEEKVEVEEEKEEEWEESITDTESEAGPESDLEDDDLIEVTMDEDPEPVDDSQDCPD